MQVKTINPMNVLYFQKRTTLQNMIPYVRVVAQRLYACAYENGLEATGPIYWIYYGMDGNPETEFTLKIALPIHQCNTLSGEVACERLEAFSCAWALHSDVWENLPQTYGKLIEEIQVKGYSMNGICREIYIHMDFEHPEYSITEVQIGVGF